MRVAIITTEILPPFSVPCAGGGVRAWGLGETLRSAGMDCLYFLPDDKIAGLALPLNLPMQSYKPELLHQQIIASGCDAVLFEQWQPLTFLQEELPIPVAVDLPGPLILEYYWRDPQNYFQHIVDKVECLAKADYFICALERQRSYYMAWLVWAGLSPAEDNLSVLPFCFPEMPFSRQGHVEDEPIFFWGGMFWPWHDRSAAFRSMAETLFQIRQGQIDVVGGGANLDDIPKNFQEYINHPYISWIGNLCFAEYICELKRAAVAVDVCYPTAERKLSSDLRTGTSLWAGVPCLVSKESAWAELIEQQNAGWVVDYGDEKTLRTLTREIALERGDLVAKRRGARTISQLISKPLEKHPFLTWLKNPQKRPKTGHFFESREKDREQRLKDFQNELHLVRHERDSMAHDLNAIRSKPIFQFYKKITHFFGA